MEGTTIHVILDGGKDPESMRRQLEREHGDSVRVHLLEVFAIEEYFSRQAIAAWLAVHGHPDDPLDGFEAAAKSERVLEWLQACSHRLLGRSFSKANDGKTIARLTPREDIPERIRAIVVVLAPSSAASRPDHDLGS